MMAVKLKVRLYSENQLLRFLEFFLDTHIFFFIFDGTPIIFIFLWHSN
jgi:hypothetical protein